MPAMRRRTMYIMAAAALLEAGSVQPADAVRHHGTTRIEAVENRPIGTPLMAIVSLGDQRITIYDANGWILRAPVSSGQPGYETPAGIFSVLQKEEEHRSNLYDDAEMPFMQRITWSGLALHAGVLPGHPASHGCIRMPHEFAERLYEMTRPGMRVIVSRTDIRPVQIDHPVLFQPKPVRADIALKELSAYWDIARANAEAPVPEAPALGADAPILSSQPEPAMLLKSAAQAKMAEAKAAARKAESARSMAARLTMEALRLVRTAEIAKARAEAQVRAAEGAVEAAKWQPAGARAQDAKAAALATLAEAERQLDATKLEAALQSEAAARAREEAKAAEAEKTAALRASEDIERLTAPVSVFISRKTQRLYVRQAFQPVLEIPVTIRGADNPIGTHVYTAVSYTDDGKSLNWSAVSMPAPAAAQPAFEGNRHGDGHRAGPPGDATAAKAALDRIEIPREIADRISEVISPGSSLIVSDEGLSAETGKETEFVILMSGEPQGGIKIRHHAPEARYERSPYERYERAYRRPPAVYSPWYYPGGSFFPW